MGAFNCPPILPVQSLWDISSLPCQIGKATNETQARCPFLRLNDIIAIIKSSVRYMMISLSFSLSLSLSLSLSAKSLRNYTKIKLGKRDPKGAISRGRGPSSSWAISLRISAQERKRLSRSSFHMSILPKCAKDDVRSEYVYIGALRILHYLRSVYVPGNNMVELQRTTLSASVTLVSEVVCTTESPIAHSQEYVSTWRGAVDCEI